MSGIGVRCRLPVFVPQSRRAAVSSPCATPREPSSHPPPTIPPPPVGHPPHSGGTPRPHPGHIQANPLLFPLDLGSFGKITRPAGRSHSTFGIACFISVIPPSGTSRTHPPPHSDQP